MADLVSALSVGPCLDLGDGRFDGPGQIHRDEFELLMKNPEMHFAASPGDMREKTAVAKRR